MGKEVESAHLDGPVVASTKSLVEHLCLTFPAEWYKVQQGTDVTWQRILPGGIQG